MSHDRVKPCRRCGQQVVWQRRRGGGGSVKFDLDGQPHRCAGVAKVRRTMAALGELLASEPSTRQPQRSNDP